MASEQKENNSSSKVMAIQVEALNKTFGDVKAVKQINFNVPEGTLYALLGPNGAGKTTAINIMSCNLQPDSGDVKIMGFSVKTQPQEVRKYIGICPQENILYEHLTVLENLLFFGTMYEVPKAKLLVRAKELIEKVGLTDKMNALVKNLSGGQKRRVNLLCGLVHDPQVLFLDEPTAGLDPQTRRLIWDYIRELKTQKRTVILTTHYMDEADILSDRVGIMDHGDLIAEDSAEKLKESIGKGDNIIFHLVGPHTAVESVIEKMKSAKEIASAQELVGDENAIRVTALDGISKIGQLVNEFLAQKVAVQDIQIQANSLENVFLELTGRTLRE